MTVGNPAGPRIEIFVHSGPESVDPVVLRESAGEIVNECLRVSGSSSEIAVLPRLASVEVNLVDDGVIARVHGEFMNDPTPTDVITFPHGEIIISVETATRSAREHGHLPVREAMLYLIHGLLHLNGFDDRNDEDRSEMEVRQQEILKAVSPLPAS